MPLGLKIVMTLLFAAFSLLLFRFALELVRTKSLRASLDEYERNPAARTFIRRWMFGWVLGIQRSMHRSMTEGRGDAFFSGFLKVAGGFFLLFSVAIWAYIVFLWFVIPLQA